MFSLPLPHILRANYKLNHAECREQIVFEIRDTFSRPQPGPECEHILSRNKSGLWRHNLTWLWRPKSLATDPRYSYVPSNSLCHTPPNHPCLQKKIQINSAPVTKMYVANLSRQSNVQKLNVQKIQLSELNFVCVWNFWLFVGVFRWNIESFHWNHKSNLSSRKKFGSILRVDVCV